MVARLKDNIDTQYHTCHCWFSSVQKYTVSYNSLIVNVVRIHTTTTCSGHVFFTQLGGSPLLTTPERPGDKKSVAKRSNWITISNFREFFHQRSNPI